MVENIPVVIFAVNNKSVVKQKAFFDIRKARILYAVNKLFNSFLALLVFREVCARVALKIKLSNHAVRAGDRICLSAGEELGVRLKHIL